MRTHLIAFLHIFDKGERDVATTQPDPTGFGVEPESVLYMGWGGRAFSVM